MASADHLTRDSLIFLEALFGQCPVQSVLAVTARNGKGLGRSRFPLSPEEALPLVLGVVDTYVRITPLAHKPKRGRGSAADAVALPGVWAEIDVNGTPDGKGGVKTGALPSLDAAVELAGCVLEPTMLVRSGGGVHAYHLLHEPMVLDTDDARERAARLVEGWQRRLRQEARERYGAGLDATHDLARILRPVGSVNGKGDTPRPVELLDDGGQRYSLAEIEAEVAAPEHNEVKAADETAARSVEELLRKYPKLSRLAKRDGHAPGDKSLSAWDYALCCEAMREPRSCTDVEVEALLHHARRGDPKGERADYIPRTIANARAEVGGDSTRQAPPRTAPAAAISRAWGIDGEEGDPVVSGYLVGEGRDAIVKLRRRGGEVMRIERLGLLFDTAAHNREASIVARSRFPALKLGQAHDVAQAVIELCKPEPFTEADEGADLLYGVLGELASVVRGVMDGTTEQLWDVLVRRGRVEQAARAKPGRDRASVGMRDEHGRAWLPSSTVRAAAGFPTWGALKSLVTEAGWTVRRVDVWEPGVERSQAKHIRRVFYVEPEAPEEAQT